jgi:hypothetical protein
MKGYVIATCMLLLMTGGLHADSDSANAVESAPARERWGTTHAQFISSKDVPKSLPALENRPLYMHYWLDKSEYLTAEPIFFKSQLENTGSETTYFQTLDPSEEIREFQLLDSLKVPLKMSRGWGVVTMVGESDTWQALEAHSMEPPYWDYLFDHYGWQGSPMDFYLKPGTYYLTHSRVPADTVAFRVAPPKDSVLSAALDQFLRCADDESIYGHPDRLYDYYERLVSSYPSTVYTPRMLNNLISVYAVARRDSIKMQRSVVRMILDFPRSRFLLYSLRDIRPWEVPSAQRDSVAFSLRTFRETVGDVPAIVQEVDSVLRVLAASEKK